MLDSRAEALPGDSNIGRQVTPRPTLTGPRARVNTYARSPASLLEGHLSFRSGLLPYCDE